MSQTVGIHHDFAWKAYVGVQLSWTGGFSSNVKLRHFLKADRHDFFFMSAFFFVVAVATVFPFFFMPSFFIMFVPAFVVVITLLTGLLIVIIMVAMFQVLCLLERGKYDGFFLFPRFQGHEERKNHQ